MDEFFARRDAFMKVKKQSAQYHSIVFTERRPQDAYQFEAFFDKFLLERVGIQSSYIKYKHAFGKKISSFSERIKKIHEIFGDIGNSKLSVRKIRNDNIGETVIMCWKNPKFRVLDRPIKRIPESIYNHVPVHKPEMFAFT